MGDALWPFYGKMCTVSFREGQTLLSLRHWNLIPPPFRISRQVWMDLQTLWPADFPITALAYWRKMGCKCWHSAKCQCVLSSDHISVNNLCNPHNVTSDFCSTKKNTPLLSFKLKYSVFQFENILMGFDTANGFWDRRARLCNVHFQGHSVVRQRHRRLWSVRWPVPPIRVLARHTCGRAGGGNVRSLYWEWVLLRLPIKIAFFF